jgi:isoquinoline 1-oxidoreductase beta subunit
MFGYSFPNLLIDHAVRNPHVPAGFWRGVNLNQNTVSVESFIDEIAHATQQDRLALRRKLLAHSPKFLAVLNAAAERAGWGTPAPDVPSEKGGQKVFRGLCVTHGFGSCVAACAEVSVSADGGAERHLRGQRPAHPHLAHQAAKPAGLNPQRPASASSRPSL